MDDTPQENSSPEPEIPAETPAETPVETPIEANPSSPSSSVETSADKESSTGGAEVPADPLGSAKTRILQTYLN